MEVNEYEKPATDFLKKTRATLDIEFVGKKINYLWHEDNLRYLYSVTITTPLGVMCFDYWHYMASSDNIPQPTAYDILSSLETTKIDSLEEFADEFSYSLGNKETYVLYSDYCAICNGLYKIFTPEQIEELSDIL